MRMRAIKSICTKAKQFILYEGGNAQWIGTEDAIYRVDDTITLTENAIPDIFDISDKKLEKIEILTKQLKESDLCPADGSVLSDSEMMGEWSAVIQEMGNQYKFLESRDHRLYMIDYSAIFGGTESGVYRRFYLLKNQKGEAVIALSDGMITTGMMRPVSGEKMAAFQKGLRNLGFMQPGIAPKQNDEEEEENPLEEQMMLDELKGPAEEEYDDSFSDS